MEEDTTSTWLIRFYGAQPSWWHVRWPYLPHHNRHTLLECSLSIIFTIYPYIIWCCLHTHPQPACTWDGYISECCAKNVSKPSPMGGMVCPCTTPCCAHKYNDPKIQKQAIAAYTKATSICQSGTDGDQYVTVALPLLLLRRHRHRFLNLLHILLLLLLLHLFTFAAFFARFNMIPTGFSRFHSVIYYEFLNVQIVCLLLLIVNSVRVP